MAYDFTQDWSTSWLATWPTLLASYVGKPDLQFIEIGSYEGRSATWLVDNVLTGEGCMLVCVDAWSGYGQRPDDDMVEVERRFDRNIESCARSSYVVDKMKMPSVEALTTLAGWKQQSSYDVIYIDGSHAALDVLVDGALAWPLLKVGGLLIFDDYNWEPAEGTPGGRPREAIDAFLSVVGVEAVVVMKGAQVAVRKVAG